MGCKTATRSGKMKKWVNRLMGEGLRTQIPKSVEFLDSY